MKTKLHNICLLDYKKGTVNYYVIRPKDDNYIEDINKLLKENNHEPKECSWIIFDAINEKPLFKEIHRLQELLNEKEKQNNR